MCLPVNMVWFLQPFQKNLKDGRQQSKRLGHRRVDDEGTVTYKRRPTDELMGSIQLGIAESVGKSRPDRDMLFHDFTQVETVNFPASGTDSTAAHRFSAFKFKSYAPLAFRGFRNIFQIEMMEFMV